MVSTLKGNNLLHSAVGRTAALKIDHQFIWQNNVKSGLNPLIKFADADKQMRCKCIGMLIFLGSMPWI